MIKRYIFCAICLVLLIGCEAPGIRVLNELNGHYDAMIRIIKDNKMHPKIAKEKLAEYQDAHGVEYAGLVKELEEIAPQRLEDKQFEQKLQEFTEKNYELVKLAAAIGINASLK
jgi:hypothetical protein